MVIEVKKFLFESLNLLNISNQVTRADGVNGSLIWLATSQVAMPYQRHPHTFLPYSMTAMITEICTNSYFGHRNKKNSI